MFLSVNHILQAGGILAVALIIFAECGLLVGFFLPGDTLLIAAGILAAQGKLPLSLILPAAAIAAILGYQAGYHIGKRAGPHFFKREEGLLRREYLVRAEKFFGQHGGKTILFARFIAVVRTVIPLVAGMGKMDKRRFLFYNIVGGVVWTVSVTLAAFWLGKRIPNLDHYIIFLVILAVVVTSGTVLIELGRSRAKRRELIDAISTEFKYLFKKKS